LDWRSWFVNQHFCSNASFPSFSPLDTAVRNTSAG